MTDDVLKLLAATLEQRKQADPATSYVASLYARGLPGILEKIGEEATEVVLAANSGEKTAIIHETADLWFHTLVLLAQSGLGPEDILAELEKRMGRSGLEEKRGRNTPASE
ncbi:MAG: phosphoribosyl-ATP diphosphatase [Gammaproteobacteria bacterium]